MYTARLKLTSRIARLTLIGLAALAAGCSSITGGSPPNIYQGAVYIADSETAGVDELFLTDPDGTETIKLSAALVTNGNVQRFEVSPNIGFVAYLADQDTDNVNELYFVKQNGEGVSKVNPDLAIGQNVTDFAWAPNGRFIAFLADADTPGLQELYVSDAREVYKVSPDGMTGNIVSFEWSPDSAYIAYTARLTQASNVELYVSDARGDEVATQVSDTLQNGSGVTKFEWSPASLYIAYLADENANGVIELFSITVSSLEKNLLSSITDGAVHDFAWANSGLGIAYTANRAASDGIDLYVANATTQNTGDAVSGVGPGGNVVDGFEWAPNDSRIAYVADQDEDEVFELYVTDSATGTKISGAMAPGGDVDTVDGFLWSLFSNQVIYRADQRTDGVYELFSSTLDGVADTTGVRISGDLVTGGSVDDEFRLSPFSTSITYIADQESVGVYDLYSTSLTGNGNVVKLSASASLANTVYQHDWFSDGLGVFYIADQDTDGINDVYTTSLTDLTNLNLSNSPATSLGVKQSANIDTAGVSENLLPF